MPITSTSAYSANTRSLTLPIFQVYGANTDVGKTVISAGLCIEAGLSMDAVQHSHIHYIKPLQTGYDPGVPGGDDAQFVQFYFDDVCSEALSTDKAAPLSTETCFTWETPVSPHLAARMENKPLSDPDLLKGVSESIVTLENEHNQKENASSTQQPFVLVETAGGPLSPAPSLTLQADVYRELRIPVILVADFKLGGISSTLSAFESLQSRGYDVLAVAMLEEPNQKSAPPTSNGPKSDPDFFDNRYALSQQLLRPDETTGEMVSVPVISIPMPPTPSQVSDDSEKAKFGDLSEYFRNPTTRTGYAELYKTIINVNKKRVQAVSELQERTRKVVWWPFTQHKSIDPDPQRAITVIDSAYGDDFLTLKPKSIDAHRNNDDNIRQREIHQQPMFDACASWWTQGVGHGNGTLARSAAYAAGRYGHIMFPENAHSPATLLSEKLIELVGQNWASRVFYSDDGSTAIEVALKMAFRKVTSDRERLSGKMADDFHSLVVLAQQNCYHGDTLGAMNVALPSVFNEQQHPWFQSQEIACDQGEWKIILPDDMIQFVTEKMPEWNVSDIIEMGSSTIKSSSHADLIERQINSESEDQFGNVNRNANADALQLRSFYEAYVRKQLEDFLAKHSSDKVSLGCVLIEPLVIGAGGMILVDPLFQSSLVRVARDKDYNLPIIYDEVFSGLYRVGTPSAGSFILQENPDIACFAKLLTGGTLPLAVTMASEEVYRSFYGDTKAEALLHGHSYTANAVGCQAALAALTMYKTKNANENIASENLSNSSGSLMNDYWPVTDVEDISRHKCVEKAWACGTILAVAIADQSGGSGGYSSTASGGVIKRLRERGVFARPLGNICYLMCAPTSTKDSTRRQMDVLRDALNDFEMSSL
eukprot:g1355.t1